MSQRRNIATLRIKRQLTPKDKPYLEEFEVQKKPRMNVISALLEIQRNPVTRGGQKTSPVAWECSCLEEVCGACSMLINGRVRQVCAAFLEELDNPVTLEPLSKFPIVKDLIVDRSVMFESLKRIRAWIPIEGTYNLGPGPKVSPAVQRWAYELSRCMTCGCCVEACPQVNSRQSFIGAAAIAQVRLFNSHPTGAMNKDERLEALVAAGGIGECANAQNCERVCPKNLPLAESIAIMKRQSTFHLLKKIFHS